MNFYGFIVYRLFPYHQTAIFALGYLQSDEDGQRRVQKR